MRVSTSVITGSQKSILSCVGTVHVPAMSFRVQDVLSGVLEYGNVRIVRADVNKLVRIFGAEENLPARSVAVYQVDSTIDEDDVFGLLGQRYNGLSLGHLFYLKGLQSEGQDGVLSTNDQPTVIYHDDAEGRRQAILVLWEDGLPGGWHIRVYDPMPSAGVSESLYPGTRILRVVE